MRDPDGDRTQSGPPDRDPEATQAYTPTFDEQEPIAPLVTPADRGPGWSAESLLPLGPVDPETPEPVPAPAEPTALDLLFGEDRFEEVAPVPTGAAAQRAGDELAAGGAAVPAPPRPPLDRQALQRRLIPVAGGALAVLVLLGLFALGTRLPGLMPEPDVAVTAAPMPGSAAPLGPVEPGVHGWDELRGGECLEPFADAWAEQFTVVDCAEPHSAQLTLVGSYLPAPEEGAETEPPLPPFPGEAELAAGVDALCAAAGALDYAAARDITDGRMQGSFPVTEEQWADDPSYRCFFSRTSGGSLTGSVAPSA